MEQELVKREDVGSLPFVLMDKLDDSLIIAELEGKMPDVLTYHFKDKGQEIWGLSKAGVDEAKAELSKQGEALRVLDYQYIDQPDCGMFIVKVGRYVISKDGKEIMLDSTLGSKRQPKKTVYGKDNPFWFEQGISKAQRNAFHSLIPKSIVQAVIEYSKTHGKVKEVSSNGDYEQKTRPKDAQEGQENPKSIPEHGVKEGFISVPQARRFYALAKQTGVEDDVIKTWLKNNYGISSTKEIPLAKYDEIVKAVQEQLPEFVGGE